MSYTQTPESVLIAGGPVDQGAAGGSPWPVEFLTAQDVTVGGPVDQGAAGAAAWPVEFLTAQDVTVGNFPADQEITVVGRRARATHGAAGSSWVPQADEYGRLKTVGGGDYDAAAVQATASGDTQLIAAQGSGFRTKLIRVEASNSHATDDVVIGLKTSSINGGSVFGKRYLPAAGGAAVWQFPNGQLMGGDNAAWNVNLDAAGTVEVTAFYEVVAN